MQAEEEGDGEADGDGQNLSASRSCEVNEVLTPSCVMNVVNC